MLNSISIGKFYNIKSAIHNMNPTSKIICTLVFLASTLLASTPQILGILALLMLFIIILSRIPIKLFINQVFSLRYLIIFLIAIYYFTGQPLNELISLISKLILIVMYTAILTLTTKPTEITTGLEEFLAPLTIIKIPIASMALMISLALRFIPTILEQARRILKSLAARGIDYYNSGFKTKIKAINILLIPMFILSFKRADQLADAMDVRLYNYDKKRTNYNAKNWGITDYVIIVLHIGVLAYMTLGRLGIVWIDI